MQDPTCSNKMCRFSSSSSYMIKVIEDEYPLRNPFNCFHSTVVYVIKKMNSFESNENIQKKEDEPDRSVSNNQFSSVTLNEPAMKARECIL